MCYLYRKRRLARKTLAQTNKKRRRRFRCPHCLQNTILYVRRRDSFEPYVVRNEKKSIASVGWLLPAKLPGNVAFMLVLRVGMPPQQVACCMEKTVTTHNSGLRVGVFAAEHVLPTTFV